MTTLITGAGLIGAHVGHELQARGERVVLYDIAPSKEYLATILALEDAEVLTGDITDLTALTSVVDKQHVDRVVHTAGLIGARVSRQPYRGVQVNVDGTLAVMEAAHLGGVKRLVFCSSMAIYDFDPLPAKSLIAEDCPKGPKNLYGATKLACEHLLDQCGALYDIDVVHLRLAGVYGRGQYVGGSWMGRVLNRAVEACIAGGQVIIKPEWIGTNEYVYVKDVARAFASACLLPQPLRGPFNIGTGVLHSFSEFVREIEALVPNGQIKMDEPDAPIVSYLERDQAFDISKAQRELGFNPHYTFREGLQDYYNELKRFAGSYERLD